MNPAPDNSMEDSQIPSESNSSEEFEMVSADVTQTDGEWEGWEELMGKDIMMKTIEKWEGCDANNSPLSDSGEWKTKKEAEVGDVLVVCFEGYCINDDSDSDSILNMFDKLKENKPFMKAKEWLITLGEGDVLQGLEMAFRFLPSDECAVVKCHSKYAYAINGRLNSISSRNEKDDEKYAVPPDSNVVYRIYTSKIIDAGDIKKSDSLQIKIATQKKDIGNDCYKHDWTVASGGDDANSGKTRALKAYGGAVDLLKNLVKDIGERESPSEQEVKDGKEAISVLVDTLNNLSAVHLRAKSYGLAREAAGIAIQYDRDNLKALCRAAKANMMDPAGLFEETELAIQVAEELHKDSDEVKKLRIEFEQRKKEYKKKAKAMFSRMMNGLSGDDEGKEEKKESVDKAETNIPNDKKAEDCSEMEEKEEQPLEEKKEVMDNTNESYYEEPTNEGRGLEETKENSLEEPQQEPEGTSTKSIDDKDEETKNEKKKKKKDKEDIPSFCSIIMFLIVIFSMSFFCLFLCWTLFSNRITIYNRFVNSDKIEQNEL